MSLPDGTVRVALFGAGVMGTGIATLATAYGAAVDLVDVDESALAGAAERVRQGRRLGQVLGRLPRDREPGALAATTSPSAAAGADVVIEAVVEVPGVKRDVIGRISREVEGGTPIVSTTSAIPIDELAGHAGRPADVVGAHFMNPAQLIKTIEVIRGPRSSPQALDRVIETLRGWDLHCIVVGDGPGFVINRMLQRTINEAARVVEEGIASAEDVDALFCGCLGHQTGPLSTADLIGLDNVVDSLEVLHERTGDAGYRPCALLLEKIAARELGRKTGKGFYEY